jgi:hypothetical protein
MTIINGEWSAIKKMTIAEDVIFVSSKVASVYDGKSKSQVH